MYKPLKDESGRQVVRYAAAKKGWTYLAHPIEIETSVIGGAYSADWTGVARTDFTLKLYDASDVEITTQPAADTSCVKSVLTWSPDYDYEIIGGNIHQESKPSSDVRLWTIGGAIELGVLGVKEFVSGINLFHMGADEAIETDGRASKFMAKTTVGVPYNTNQLQFILRHPAGYKHKVMSIVEYFRA